MLLLPIAWVEKYSHLLVKNCIVNLFLFIVILAPTIGIAQTDSNNPPYQWLWEQGKYHEALKQLNEDIESRPELERIRSYRYCNWLSHRAELNLLIGNYDEAIADLEWLIMYIEEAPFYYRLLKLYDLRGKKYEYDLLLDKLDNYAIRRYGFHSREEELLAYARIAELKGENPKQLLSSIYNALMKNYPSYVGGFIGAGELAYRNRAYDLAEKYFNEALSLEPRHQKALEGLCLTYWQSNDPRLMEYLEQLIAVNENSFTAYRIQIERLLDHNKPNEALDLVDQVLAINPNHLIVKSLQSAAYFLLDRDEDVHSIQEEILAYNPYASEVYRIPGRIASRHYRFKEASEMQLEAINLDPEDSEARALYGLDLLRLGREDEGKRQLEIAFEKDPFHVHVFNMLNLLDSISKFAQVEEGPFRLQLPKNEQFVLAKDALSLLTEAITLYQHKYDIELETPVHVQMFDDHDDFMVRSLGLPGMVGFLGICFGKLVTMDSPSARPKGAMNWRSVLWHEFVHVITLQKTNNRMSRWLSEGISVYEETQKDPAWGQTLDVQYKPILESEDLPGLLDLESYFNQPKTSLHLMLGYFLGGEFVQYYVDIFGSQALSHALKLIADKTDTNQALIEASGATLEDIDQGFKQFLKERIAPYDNLPQVELPDEEPDLMERIFGGGEEDGPWIDRPSPFTDALREGNQAMEAKDFETAEESFKRAYELFPDYDGPGKPIAQLIQLYKQTHQTNKLIETLYLDIQTNATALQSCLTLLDLLIQEKNWSEVTKIADRALGINPFDIDVRRAYLLGLKESRQHDQAYAAAQLLANLDETRSTQYRIQGIDLLMKSNRWEEAKHDTIALLEQFPHYWEAQHRLLRIAEREETLQ